MIINRGITKLNLQIYLHINAPGKVVDDWEDRVDHSQDNGLNDVQELVRMTDDHHVQEHERRVGGVCHHIHRVQFVGFVEQDAPVNDGDADGDDQSHVVEPPVDLKGKWHVLYVVGIVWK